MRKLSKKFWLYSIGALLAVVGIVVSIIKGWNIAAIVFAVAALILSIFAVKEYHKGGLFTGLAVDSASVVDGDIHVYGKAFGENAYYGGVFVNGNRIEHMRQWSDSVIVCAPEFVPDSAVIYVINGDNEKSNSVEVLK